MILAAFWFTIGRKNYLITQKLKVMNVGKLAAGILIAAAAGAVLGVLLAPDKGSETRKKISKKGSDLKDMFKSRMNDLVDDMANRYDGLKDEAGKAVNSGKETANTLKADAKHALS
jgi:gas vesicle protein